MRAGFLGRARVSRPLFGKVRLGGGREGLCCQVNFHNPHVLQHWSIVISTSEKVKNRVARHMRHSGSRVDALSHQACAVAVERARLHGHFVPLPPSAHMFSTKALKKLSAFLVASLAWRGGLRLFPVRQRAFSNAVGARREGVVSVEAFCGAAKEWKVWSQRLADPCTEARLERRQRGDRPSNRCAQRVPC